MDLPQNAYKQLEYEFHSSSYHILIEVVVGLNTLLGHLAKVSGHVCEEKEVEGFHWHRHSLRMGKLITRTRHCCSLSILSMTSQEIIPPFLLS